MYEEKAHYHGLSAPPSNSKMRPQASTLYVIKHTSPQATSECKSKPPNQQAHFQYFVPWMVHPQETVVQSAGWLACLFAIKNCLQAIDLSDAIIHARGVVSVCKFKSRPTTVFHCDISSSAIQHMPYIDLEWLISISTHLRPSESGMANEGGLVMGRPPVGPPVLAMYIGWLYIQCSQLEDSILWKVELAGVSQRKSPHTYSCPICNIPLAFLKECVHFCCNTTQT